MDQTVQEKIDSLVGHFTDAMMESPDAVNAHANELARSVTPHFVAWLDKMARLSAEGHVNTGEVMTSLVLSHAKLIAVFLHVVHDGETWDHGCVEDIVDIFDDCLRHLTDIHKEEEWLAREDEEETLQ